MKCSLKYEFVILLTIFFAPSEGKGHPLFLRKNPIADQSINLNDFLVMSNVEQILDSFPSLKDYDKMSHKIVKKQMTESDYKHRQKNKRSAFSVRESSSCENNVKCEEREKNEHANDCGADDKCQRNILKLLDETFNVNRDLERREQLAKKTLTKGDLKFRRSILNKKQKGKKIIENGTQQTQETSTKTEIQNTNEVVQQTEKTVEKVTEKPPEKQKEKAIEKATGKENEQTAQSKVKEKEDEKDTQQKVKAKEEKVHKNNDSVKNKNVDGQPKELQEQFKVLKNMVGCKMQSYCRFPDLQNNHCYFECESNSDGCITLTHKTCPGDEIFSSRYLECLNPFFWKLVEREKRSLWKKGTNQQYINTWTGKQPANAWTDVTHEEEKQFPLEFKPKFKPKLVVYHLKVKKSINEQFRRGKKEQRHAFALPRLIHAEANRRLTQKASGMRNTHHQLYPRSFVIRLNKKEGQADPDHDQESISEDESEDDIEDEENNEDDEEDDEEGEETNEEEEEVDDDGDNKKCPEKGGIKEFFKSAKEAITSRARFNEPANTSFTLDKTNSYSTNKKFDDSETDSRKILIDADIKVDKTLGRTLKKILAKRKNKDEGNVPGKGSFADARENQGQVESEKNLMRSRRRLKRHFSGPWREGKLNRKLNQGW